MLQNVFVRVSELLRSLRIPIDAEKPHQEVRKVSTLRSQQCVRDEFFNFLNHVSFGNPVSAQQSECVPDPNRGSKKHHPFGLKYSF
jgi:hypothetical protein